MARAPKLKVFRTPIGFHDAYVAVPSQKAALEAWGADSNLFASGSAELVRDPELTREPLAKPGQVVRRLRGSLAEHVAALPKTMPARAARAGGDPVKEGGGAVAVKPKPRPSRAALDRAEAALADLRRRHDEAQAELARRLAELERERRALASKQERELSNLETRAEAARAKFDRAMSAWRAD